jgi:ketosteroid isomerase-like protein
MSQENVEVVRKAWDVWERGDLDALLALCREDLVFDTTHMHDWPETAYQGHAGLQRFLTEWLEVWDAFEVGVDELIPTADGRVVSLFWQRGEGRHSGLTMDVAWAMVAAVQDGSVARMEVYDDRAAALKAVGLAE